MASPYALQTPIALVIVVTSSFEMDREAILWIELEKPSTRLWWEQKVVSV